MLSDHTRVEIDIIGPIDPAKVAEAIVRAVKTHIDHLPQPQQNRVLLNLIVAITAEAADLVKDIDLITRDETPITVESALA